MDRDNKCPRCGERQLQSWSELKDDEREVVRRLLYSSDYDLVERRARHQWCTLCWYETIIETDRTV